MIEADKFYSGRVYRAEWLENPEDETAPTLAIGIEVDGDTITHYLRTQTEDQMAKMKRQLRAIGVSEADTYSAQFIDDPKAVIGEAQCRFKTRLTQTGKVAVGFICDPAKDLNQTARSGLMARLKAVKVNDHGVVMGDDLIPF